MSDAFGLSRRRLGILYAAVALCVAALGAWALLFARFTAEASIEAFGSIASQLIRLRTIQAIYISAGVLLSLVTLRMVWMSVQEGLRGRRLREAERLLEN